jgi:retinol-binding protein 3
MTADLRSIGTLVTAIAFGLTASQASAQTPGRSPTVALPNTPVGAVVAEWMEAFNAADSLKLGAYYAKYALERSLTAQLTRARQSGGFDVVSIEKSRPRFMELVLRERATGILNYGVVKMSDEGQPLTLTQSFVAPVPRGASIADFKIDAAARARVIEGAIAQLDSNYVFPDVAAKMASTLRDRSKRGAYDDVTNGLSFATVLTEDLQGVSKDKHLRVNYTAALIPDRPANSQPDSAEEQRYRQEMMRVNCGFEKTETLANNVGYLKFNFFADPDVCGDIASKEMAKLADVSALIVDLRENGGGSPAMVAHVSSYLFSTRTHLNDLWERRGNKTTEYWTKPELPGRKVRDNVPVYVLTANRTFSGAEEFTYNLKNLKRATIVGETTGGGAHPVSGHRINDHFMIGVPFARAINPYSKTNWEGTGVVPDVKVPAAEAMTTALRLISERKATP